MKRRNSMKKWLQGLLALTIVIISLGNAAAEEQAKKDWYVAMRMGFQPYTTEMSGKMGNADFEAKADLSDILDNTDTTLFGGEVEFGMARWFVFFSGSYQDTKAETGDTTRGARMEYEQTGINTMAGYQVLKQELGDGRAFSLDVMGGIFYVKVKNDIDIYGPRFDHISTGGSVEFLDPMVGLRMYYPFTKKFGVGLSGQIGGFGVGSELQCVASASLVYNFTDWFALSAGYKYWYWKWEDDGERLSELEQKIYGPVIGMQFKF